jgi:hypothetical protein
LPDSPPRIAVKTVRGLAIVDELDESWPDDRPATKGHEPRTAEQVKAGVQRALEKFVETGGRPGVADPTQDDEWLGPAKEFSALIVTPNVPKSRLRLWASDIQEIVDDSETGKGAAEASAAIRSIAMCKDYKWLRACNRPTHQGFANALLAALWGQALPAGDSGRHDRSSGGQEVQASGYRRVPRKGAIR